MKSKNSSPSGNAGGSGEALARGQKVKINRVRTGCLTCRRRRKKCDESRPACKACVKTNILCEGYPPRTLWGSRTTVRRATKSKSTPSIDGDTMSRIGEMTAGWRAANLNLIPLQPSRTFEKCSPDSNGEMTQWLNEPTSPQFSPILYDQNDVNTEKTSAEDDSSFLFPQVSQPLAFEQHFGSSTQSMTMLNPPQTTNKSLILGGNGGFESTRSFNSAEACRKPPELPFLISGVESSLHRRLFTTSLMSCRES